MKVARVLLLVSVWLFCVGSEIHAMTWDYTEPYEYGLTNEYTFSYKGNLPSGSTYGVILFGNDRDNISNESIYDYAIGLGETNNIKLNNCYFVIQDDKTNFYVASDVNTLPAPVFSNGYGIAPTTGNGYYNFEVYWTIGPGINEITLPIKLAWGKGIDDNFSSYDFYAVFYVKDSTGNFIYTRGLQVGDPPPQVVPLPGTALLLGSGLAGLAFLSRRLRRR